jgi:phage gpG-like protein
VRLVIDTLGEQAVARDLLRFGHNAADVRPAMVQVLDLLRRAERRQFDSQGAYGSEGWPPLASSTVERKRREGLDPRILHATRRLRDSLTEAGHGEQIAIARHDGLDFGTTVEYARYHQHGTSRAPQRRVVQLPESDRREVVRIVQRHVVGERAGRFL